MGEIIRRNCNLGEFGVPVILPSLIQPVQVPIWRVISLICSLPITTRQVIPISSHIHSYPPLCSHHHPPSLSFSSTTLWSSQNTTLCRPWVSLYILIMRWHRVQYTPSAASTHDCLSYIHSDHYELTTNDSISFLSIFLHDWPPSASSAQKFTGNVIFPWLWINKLRQWVSAPNGPSIDCLQVLVRIRSIMASQLAWSGHPSAVQNLYNYSLQTYSITALKCISKIAQLRPLCAHFDTTSMMASKCISKLR